MSEAQEHAPTTVPFRVMTYNVHACVGTDGRLDVERIASVIRMYSPDIVALQELDEAQYWLELLVESELVTQRRLTPLMKEADELAAMLLASVRTIKRRRR